MPDIRDRQLEQLLRESNLLNRLPKQLLRDIVAVPEPIQLRGDAFRDPDFRVVGHRCFPAGWKSTRVNVLSSRNEDMAPNQAGVSGAIVRTMAASQNARPLSGFECSTGAQLPREGDLRIR